MTEWHWIVVRLSVAAVVLAWALTAGADSEDDAAMLRGTLELQRMEQQDRAFWAAQAAEENSAARSRDAARAAEQRDETNEHLRQIEQDLYYRSLRHLDD
jgi:hypothetical protein